MAEERILDRDGWPLREGARCARYSEAGCELSEQVVVQGFTSTPKHPVAIEIEGLVSGKQGMTVPGRLRVLVTPDGDKAPLSVIRYRNRKKEPELMAALAERKKKERAEKRAKKVRRKKVG